MHRGGRGQSFAYELLYQGEGEAGESFLMGLIGVAKLGSGSNYDEKRRSGSNGARSGVGPGGVRPRSGGGPTAERGETRRPDEHLRVIEPAIAENALLGARRSGSVVPCASAEPPTDGAQEAACERAEAGRVPDRRERHGPLPGALPRNVGREGTLAAHGRDPRPHAAPLHPLVQRARPRPAGGRHAAHPRALPATALPLPEAHGEPLSFYNAAAAARSPEGVLQVARAAEPHPLEPGQRDRAAAGPPAACRSTS